LNPSPDKDPEERAGVLSCLSHHQGWMVRSANLPRSTYAGTLSSVSACRIEAEPQLHHLWGSFRAQSVL